MDDENTDPGQNQDETPDEESSASPVDDGAVPGPASPADTPPSASPAPSAPEARGRPGLFRTRNLIFASSVTIIIAAIAVTALLVLRQLGSPGEATAKFLPDDTQVYFTVNLRPGAGQISKALKIESILEGSGNLNERREEWLDSLADETGIYFEDDVMPWLGKDVTLALLDAYADPLPEWVGLLQTSDREASEEFLEDRVQYLEENEFQQFEDRTRRGARIWTEDSDEISFGVTDDYVVFGANEDVVRRTISDLDSPPSNPLSENEEFIQVRDRVPEERSMLIFVNGKELIRGAKRAQGSSGFGDIESLENNLPDSLVVSGSFIDKGVRMDLVSTTPRNSFGVETDLDFGLIDALPEDTLFLMAAAGGNQVWEQFRESLEDTNEFGSRELDDLLAELEDSTGIDLERDVIEELNGYMAMALLPSDFRFDEYFEVLESGTIELVFLADLVETSGLKSLAEDLMETFEEELDLAIRSNTSRQYEVVTLDLKNLGEAAERFSPGYMFTDDLVAVGSTEDSLLRIVDTLDGEERPLSSNQKFKRLRSMAPDDSSIFVFADIASIVEMIVNAMPRDAVRNYENEVAPFLEPLDAFFLAGATTEDYMRLTWVLTVRE
jgi:hypothetical protein